MINKKKEVSYFYYHLYKGLKSLADVNDFIEIKHAKNYLGQAYRVPLPIRIVVLKEMEQAGLLTMIDKFKLKIIKKEVTELDDASKLYVKLGLW